MPYYYQILSTFLTLLLFFTLLFVYTNVAGPIPFSINSVTTTKSDLFTVVGEGKVSIKPDLAILRVGVSANGATVKLVQDQMNERINRVSDSIKKLSVDEKDIQTQNYNINPNYDYRESTQKITGYSANTNLSIKVRNIDNLNTIIDTATTAGANQLLDISFDLSDRTQAENEAREKAIQEAKKKAEQAAKIANFRLGKIINYNENFAQPYQPIPLSRTALPQAAGGVEDKQSNLEPGSTDVTVTVTLSYEIQ